MDRPGFCFEPNNGANGTAVAPPVAPAMPPPNASPELVSGPAMRTPGPPIPGPALTPEPAVDAILQEFVSRGLVGEGEYASGQEVLDTLGARLSDLGQMQDYAQLGQRFAPHQGEFQEFLRTRQQSATPAPAQQPAAPAKPKWQAPPFDPAWENRSEWSDEHGRFLPKTAMDHEAAAGLNRFVQHKRELDRQMATDPVGFLMGAGLEDRLTAIRDEAKQQALAEFRAEQQRTQHQAEIQKQQAELFVLDQNGQPRYGLNGAPVLTPKGEAFADAMAEAAELGIADQSAQQRYAMKQVARDSRFQTQTQETPVPQPQAPVRDERGRFVGPQQGVNEDQKRQFLRPAGSGHAPSRGAAEVNEQDHGIPATARGSFGQMALRLARQQGLS